jgi:WD40 repeat protein
VDSVAFAPNGRILATGSDDGTILWDLTNPAQPGRLGAPLTSRTSSVFSMAFAPNRSTLATGSANGVVLWDLTDLNDLLAHAVERACSTTRGGLDHDEWARRVLGLPYQSTCPA